jgi:nucleoside-diphosphate-sugar epimerase
LKSVMITGASGFVGFHIAQELLKLHIPVHLYTRRKNHRLCHLERNGGIIHMGKGPEDLKIIEQSLEGVDTIIHCAAATKALTKKDFFQANAVFTKNILCRMDQRQRFVLISSQAASGPSTIEKPTLENDPCNPVNNYGKSKLLAEAHVVEWGKQNNDNFLILRPCSIYGPGERDFFVYFKLIKRGLLFLPNNGMQRISIIHISDLVKAIILAASASIRGKIYFVSNDEACSWIEIGEAIKRSLEKKHLMTIRSFNILNQTVAGMFDLFGKIRGKPTLFNREKVVEANQLAWICCNKKIKTDFDWKPELSLPEGVDKTVIWYKENRWL